MEYLMWFDIIQWRRDNPKNVDKKKETYFH